MVRVKGKLVKVTEVPLDLFFSEKDCGFSGDMKAADVLAVVFRHNEEKFIKLLGDSLKKEWKAATLVDNT